MTSAIRSIPVRAPRNHLSPLGGAAMVALCAAFDAVATAILLVRLPLPPSLQIVVLAVTRGTAVLLLACMARRRPSRQWFCVAAVTAVPFVGQAVAAATLLTRGRAWAATGRRKARPRPGVTTAAMRRLGDSLSLCDALTGCDEEERHGALSELALRGDREAIAMLRWATAGPNPDLALSAALALDEIGKRAERPPGRRDVVEARREAD